MNGSSEWKGALRLQIEALAKRNDLHRRCNRTSVRSRTQEMDQQIVKLRELLAEDANKCAQFYLECVCHADETERILNRTSSRDKKRKKKLSRDISTNSEVVLNSPRPSTSATDPNVPQSLPYQDRVPQEKRWWDQLNIHRRDEYYEAGKHESRQMWRSQKDFIFSTIGFVVGVGNMVRFPAQLYRFGGGVFLIPYLICHLIIGLPLTFLQLAMSQFSGMGAGGALKRLAPIASGLGYTLLLSSIPFAVYFNVYVAYFLYYLFQSIKSIFLLSPPWDQCDAAWNSTFVCCASKPLGQCGNSSMLSTEVYFYSSLLSLENEHDQSVGGFIPHLVFSLLVAWILTLTCQRSSQNTRLLPSVTATIPYLILSCLFFCGISQRGADDGISFLFNMEVRHIWSTKIWVAAASQVLFELGLTSAPLMSLARLSRFRNNVYRDAVLVIGICMATSFLSVLVVFALLGNLAHLHQKSIEELVVLSPKFIALIVFPSMTSFLRGGLAWTILIFVMLVLTTVDAQFAWLEMLSSSIMEMVSSKNRSLENKLVAVFCVAGLLLGLPFCLKGGHLLFFSIDELITASFIPLVVLLFFMLVVTRLYDTTMILEDFAYMLRLPILTISQWRLLSSNYKLQLLFGPNGMFIHCCWSIVTPTALAILTLLSITGYERLRLAGETIPLWIELTAGMVIAAPLLTIPLFIFFDINTNRRTGKTFGSLFDSSLWSQLDVTDYGIEEESGTGGPKRRRTAMRENTYMYIDPITRANTVRSEIFSVEHNYGWRVGRLKEVQDDPSLVPSSSQPSFAASMTSQGTVTAAEFALFGSPPASNAEMLSESLSTRAKVAKQRLSRQSATDSETEQKERKEKTTLDIPMTTIHCSSEPPMKTTSRDRPPLSLSRCPSPTRSEPPLGTDRPASSVRSKSESHDEYSESDEEGDGIRRERVTVIRRYPSEESFGLQSTGSISITPIDLPRHRSLSSVAIYTQERGSRPTQTLSQLKRPAPIHAPSPTRF